MPAQSSIRGATGDAGARADHPIRYEFAGLDLLRLVACLSVLLYHYSFRGASRDGLSTFQVPSIQFATKYGFFGVDLFFIISGFVIAYSARGRTATHFFVSRVVRLYPAFITCMPISFVVIFLFGAPELQVTFKQLAANMIIVSPLLRQSFVDGVYWSIVCEIIFYSWILLLIRFGALEQKTPVLVLIWIALSSANETYLHSGALTWIVISKYSGFFAIGVMLYHGRFLGWSALAVLAMSCAIVLANLQLLDDIAYHNSYYVGVRFDPAIAVALCTTAILVTSAIVLYERCERRPPLVLLAGGITYPLYLIHQNIGYTAFNRLGSGMPQGVMLTAVASAAILCSWIIWRYVERPMQRRLRQMLLSRTVPLRLGTSDAERWRWLFHPTPMQVGLPSGGVADSMIAGSGRDAGSRLQSRPPQSGDQGGVGRPVGATGGGAVLRRSADGHGMGDALSPERRGCNSATG